MTLLVVLAGAAGTGKTALGRGLARHLPAALLDLDTLAGPLAEALLARETGDPHDDTSPYARDVVRPLRYAALTAVALEVLACGTPVVAAAPWTRELADPGWHRALSARAWAAGGRLEVVWLHCAPEMRRARLRGRAHPRDAHRAHDRLPAPPAVPHLALDTTGGTEQALPRLLGLLAPRKNPER